MKQTKPFQTKNIGSIRVNAFFAIGNFCRLLIASANSLDPDQDQQDMGPDLNQNRLTH